MSVGGDGVAGEARGLASLRPSGAAIAATLVAGVLLAGGGFAFGKTSGPTVPASVPVKTVAAPAGADPIVIPPGVELPRR